MNKLYDEIYEHYFEQLWKQIYVVILGHDILGNPFGLIRDVAHGMKSFIQEPCIVGLPFSERVSIIALLFSACQSSVEGPSALVGGIVTGTEHLIGSVIGSAASAGSKLNHTISKGLAFLTFDHDYRHVRHQRRRLRTQTASDLVESSKNLVHVGDFVSGAV